MSCPPSPPALVCVRGKGQWVAQAPTSDTWVPGVLITKREVPHAIVAIRYTVSLPPPPAAQKTHQGAILPTCRDCPSTAGYVPGHVKYMWLRRSLDEVSAPRYEMAGRDPLPSIPWGARSGPLNHLLKNVPPIHLLALLCSPRFSTSFHPSRPSRPPQRGNCTANL